MSNSATQLIHHPYRPPAEFEAVQPGVFKGSTVFFPNMAAVRERQWLDKSGYTYGLHGTPTSYTLEERLATLEGGLQCVLAPSGLAALALVPLALLKAGDEMLLPANCYEPNRVFAADGLAQFGVAHQCYEAMDVAQLAARITPRTRLVWLEAPGSVTMEFPDVLAMVRLCRERGVVCALDTTWSAGQAFDPFNLDGQGLGVDIAAPALTKYQSGGGDVLMGALITRDEALHRRLKLAHMRLGLGVGMNDVEAVLRTLPTLPLRYRAQGESGLALARWCAQQPPFVQVLHPALPGAPGHAHWQQLCGGTAAGLFSVIIDARYSSAQVDAFCEALRLFKLGYSWGGPVSLVMPYEARALRGENWPPHLQRGHVVRFAVGLEDAADLQADLQQAMARTLPPF